MATKKRQDRIAQILESLRGDGATSIEELSQRLSVSEMTVRRDLLLLAQQNRVRLVKGGAELRLGLADSPRAAFSLVSGESALAKDKMKIGKKAASLVEPGDIVIIDSGSTTEWLARSLPVDAPLTVICFALNILLEAASRSKVTAVFAGGTFRGDTLVCESVEGIALVRRFRAHKAFLSAGGVSDSLGVTCRDAAEAELKKAAIESAQTRILVVDSGKLGRVTPSLFATLSDFDAIVTDSGISLEYVQIARSRGIALYLT
ncbi:MAG: DeoR/GlpR family DNA-binding transcription regulator [Spirochaetia bacterium]